VTYRKNTVQSGIETAMWVEDDARNQLSSTWQWAEDIILYARDWRRTWGA
jgi:hypothetical protein